MKRKFIVAGTALVLAFGAAILSSGITATAQPYGGGGGMMGGPGYGYGPGWMHGYGMMRGYGPGWTRGYGRGGYGPGWMHSYRDGWSGSERRDAYDFGRMHGSGYGPGWMHQW